MGENQEEVCLQISIQKNILTNALNNFRAINTSPFSLFKLEFTFNGFGHNIGS